MSTLDFQNKLSTIAEVEPDKIDIAMIEAAEDDDISTVSLDDFKTFMDYSGKLSLRIPRSLHRTLAENAKIEGISLNQYALFKLAK